MATTQLPQAYPPCVIPVDQLEPITISQLQLETNHRGRMVVVRALTPPSRMTAILAFVEDEEETALLLQICHQLDEDLLPATEILNEGGIYLIKEPFLKFATDGSYIISVDHLGHIVALDDCDGRVPQKWRATSPKPPVSSEHYRMQGNEAVKAQRWAHARSLYTSAISAAKDVPETQSALLNRSLASLRLGHSHSALEDARIAASLGTSSEKGLFREARALYELGRYSDSLEKLRELTTSFPENLAATAEVSRSQARIREQQTGHYNFCQMYQQAKHTPPLIDCATSSKPVEVRTSPGRGLGLFTTRSVAAGGMLLCEKAFAYYHSGNDATFTTMLMNMGSVTPTAAGQARLLTQLMHKVFNSRDALQAYTSLHHGDYHMPPFEVDGHAVVDSFLVERIRALNCFGAPRTSRESFAAYQSGVEVESYSACGIWLLASRINHSCLGNCRRTFIGDIQILRATTDLEAGTELTFSYRVPETHDTYEDIQKGLSSWGFVCHCELCEKRKTTSKATVAARKKLYEDLEAALSQSPRPNLARAKKLLVKIDQTYGPSGADVSRREMWDAYFATGTQYLNAGRNKSAIGMIVRSLEALGFEVTASVPPKPVDFEVVEWGSPAMPQIFLHLHAAYHGLEVGDCVVMRLKEYARTAYSIMTGEPETFEEEFEF